MLVIHVRNINELKIFPLKISTLIIISAQTSDTFKSNQIKNQTYNSKLIFVLSFMADNRNDEILINFMFS